MSILSDILRRLTKLEREALRFRKATITETAGLEAQFGGATTSQPTVTIDGIDVDANDVVTAIGNSRNTLVLGRTVSTPNPASGGGSAPDASTTVKGIVQLAGDLSGTATSPQIAAGAVGTSEIADSAVTSAKIADGTIATADIADSAVTSAKIADATIATADIADSAITSAKISDGTIVNADVSASAAITYGKLSLTTSIVNGDISNTAAIAYSKLALTSSVVNADISATAAIAYSKLSLTGSIVNADVSATAAIAYSKLTLTGSIVNADIATGAAIALSKLATDPLARANHTGTQTASTISDFDTQVRTSRLDQMATPTANVSFGTKKITSLADPTAAQDAATKTYVDSTVTAGAPDASTTTKGLIQLAGDLTGTATSPQIAAGAVGVSELATKIGATPTYETSLPSSPPDGQEIYFAADATNSVIWHLRYRSAARSSNGAWEYLGGPPLTAETNTSRTLTNQTTYANLPTDPMSITLPSVTGDYDITIGAQVALGTAGANGVWISYAVGATGASDNWGAAMALTATSAHISQRARQTSVASGASIAEKGRTQGNYTATYHYRRLTIQPVRVW